MKIHALSDSDKLDWLRLIRSENVGVVTFNRLVELYGSAGKALDRIEDLSQKGGRKKLLKKCPKYVALAEIDNVEKIGGKIIALCEEEYPEKLRYIHDTPPVITVLGDASMLGRDSVAIVGARNASTNAGRVSYKLAGDLCENDYVAVSGLARGIDGAVHKGALAADKDCTTVAVVAGGIDHIYPKEHRDLYHEIVRNGAIIAECAFGTVPRAENFPRRNRIISGMSIGTVVVEAAERSGSLITARMALEQGREVMAVPGFPLDPRSAGTNKLIKQGASLIENISDILEVVRYKKSQKMGQLFEGESEYTQEKMLVPKDSDVDFAREEILRLVSSSAVTIDDLVIETGVPVNVILMVLMELEAS